MTKSAETPISGVVPYSGDDAMSVSLPNRYVLREDDKGPYLTCLEAPNVTVRVERGFTASSASAKKAPPHTIYLDGAAQGEPFMDVKRKVYNLDHHEGCVRAFTLATCEQAMVLILKGLDLREGDWTVWGNEPDLDTVLAIWVLLNHVRLSGDNPEIRRRLMPVLRMQGTIDAHGFELRELCGFPGYLEEQTQAVIDVLRASEVELKQTGQWQTANFLEYTASVLRSVDEVLYSPGHFDDLQQVEELARFNVANNRIGVVCHSEAGIYEVEESLRKLHGERVGVLVLQKNPSTYTLRLVDSFLPTTLDPIYDRLNQLEPQATSTNRWGGSSEIGGSPRGSGTRLEPQQIARICDWVYNPPDLRARLVAILGSVGLVAVVLCLAAVAAFRGVPPGPWPGLLAAASAKIQLTFGSVTAVLSLALVVPAVRGLRRTQHGLRVPVGWAWLSLLPIALVAALGGGAWAARQAGPDGVAWGGLLVGVLAAELLFHGVVHGRLVARFQIRYPGGGWSISVPNVVSALLYTGAVVVLFVGPAVAEAGDGMLVVGPLMAGSALVLALAGGLARERSGSLLAPLALHAAAVSLVWAGTLLLGV